MNKKGAWMLWASIAFVLVLIVALFLYQALYTPHNELLYAIPPVNPAAGLSDEQAIAQFNESFVMYLLWSIEAYNLHNVPLSSNKPVMEIVVSDTVYHAVIDNGLIVVGKGNSAKKDIVIRTHAAEAVKMLKDKAYVEQSFASGASVIDLIAGKATLFEKGYLNLYTKLTGKGVTGNVIRIYAS